MADISGISNEIAEAREMRREQLARKQLLEEKKKLRKIKMDLIKRQLFSKAAMAAAALSLILVFMVDVSFMMMTAIFMVMTGVCLAGADDSYERKCEQIHSIWIEWLAGQDPQRMILRYEDEIKEMIRVVAAYREWKQKNIFARITSIEVVVELQAAARRARYAVGRFNVDSLTE